MGKYEAEIGEKIEQALVSELRTLWYQVEGYLVTGMQTFMQKSLIEVRIA